MNHQKIKQTTITTLNERVQFDSGFLESRNDDNSNVISHVAIVGEHSLNGYDFPPEVLTEACPLVSGVPCFLNHEGFFGGDGRIQSIVGSFSNPTFENGKIFADLTLLDNDHANLVKQIAQTNFRPGTIGMSIFASGEIAEPKKKGERPKASKINEFHSVDLVARPAATKTLFESLKDEGGDSMDWKDVTIEDLVQNRPDIVNAIQDESMKPLQEEIQTLQASVKTLTDENFTLKTESLLAQLDIPKDIQEDAAVMSVIRDVVVKENGLTAVQKMISLSRAGVRGCPPSAPIEDKKKKKESLAEFAARTKG